MTFGKDYTNKGKKFTEEHRNRISKALMGKKLSKDHIEKIKLVSKFKKRYKQKDIFSKETMEKLKKYYDSLKGKSRPKWIGEKISQSKLGHSVSQEARDKISKAFKGKTYEQIMGKEKAEIKRKESSQRATGKNNPFFNKRHSEDMKEKLSLLKLGKSHEEIMGEENAKKWKERMSGQNSPCWRGGYSIKDYKNFTNRLKNIVRKRDNQVCMVCGKHREKMNTSLSIHHIDYDKSNSTPQNCISICEECHPKTNFNRKYWIEFFKSLMTERYDYDYENIHMEIVNDKQ